ncbi:MAG: hypothetical protein KAS72_04095 [Phycisphaerales bacterium]|nr:hypothetical protein [Phycisphaerales bacterium]
MKLHHTRTAVMLVCASAAVIGTATFGLAADPSQGAEASREAVSGAPVSDAIGGDSVRTRANEVETLSLLDPSRISADDRWQLPPGVEICEYSVRKPTRSSVASTSAFPWDDSETIPARSMGTQTRETDGQQAAFEPVPLHTRLADIDPSIRFSAILKIDLGASPTAGQEDTANYIETLWNGGAFDDAVSLLSALEAEGAVAGMGITWRDPDNPGQFGLRGTDVRIGGTRTGAFLTVVDYDAASGNCFVVASWPQYWTMNISYDDGTSWAETFTYYSGPGLVDIDAAVMGAHIYVGYVHVDMEDIARIRRCSVSNGVIDGVYNYKTVADVSPETITDIALETNVDDYDNRVYYLFRKSNGALQLFYGRADENVSIFHENSPAVTDAAGGIDLHWNDNPTTWFLFLSYIGTDGYVHVERIYSVWEECGSFTFSGYNTRTAISAYADAVFVAYEHMYTEDYGIRYKISYDGGEGTWFQGDIAIPDVAGEFYAMADATARGGGGIALMYQQELGAVDPVFVRYRSSYTSANWDAPVQINDYDVAGDSWTAINWLPPLMGGSGAYGYGMTYIDGLGDRIPWFDRIDGANAQEGDNCDVPIEITLPAALPYYDVNTTCGRLDDYNNSCMGYYDGGEDIIYELTVTSTVTVDITLDADTDWAGVGVFSQCPTGPDGCVATATSSADPDVITGLELTPGTYYIMVDTWPSPDCCDFVLIIETTFIFDEDCPGNSMFSQLPDSPIDAWTAGNSDVGEGYTRFDNYIVGQDIGSIQWWGLNAFLDTGGWEECVENPMEFEIGFYYDDGGQPGALACEYTVVATGVDTGYTYGTGLDFTLFRYTVDLDAPCTLHNGWVSVRGISDPVDCWFMWMSSDDGDGTSWFDDNGAGFVQDYDLSVCLSPAPCFVECPPDAFDEPEPCGDDTNGGCNMATPQFTSIDFGETVCGTAWYNSSTRDTDWYEVVLTEPAELTWTVEAEFDVLMGVIAYIPGSEGSGDCADITGSVDPYLLLSPCDEDTVTSATLPAGTYWLFVAPQFTSLINCGENDAYVATLTGGPTECVGDMDGDWDRDQNDLGILLASYDMCEGDPYYAPAADLDGDGCVTQFDLGIFLAVYEIPCP